MHNYPLEKYHFYVHGNRVIAVSTYAGKSVRGVAVCSAEDEFDLEKGKKLAAARCNAKIAEKRVHRAFNRLADAHEEVNSAINHRDKMCHYYNDAVKALQEARKSLDDTF